MSAIATGVYPCYKNQFKIGAADSEELNPIADTVTFSVSFNDGVEEWNPYDQEGWARRLKTSKSVNVSVTAKRNIGDPGNDYVASLAFKNGREAEVKFQWDFPDGTKVVFNNAVLVISALSASDSTAVAPLEFEIQSNGKVAVTLPTSLNKE